MIDRKSGRRRIGYLTNLTIKELSGVDRPANPGARVVLFKSQDGVQIVKRYDSNEQLPDVIKSNLPSEAQDTFRLAVNSAFEKDADADEEAVFKTAWNAVKDRWHRQDDKWVAKAAPPFAKKPVKGKPKPEEVDAEEAEEAAEEAAAAAAADEGEGAPSEAPEGEEETEPADDIEAAAAEMEAEGGEGEEPVADAGTENGKPPPKKGKGKQAYPWMQYSKALGPGAKAEDYIHDFVHSSNPRFRGKSKKDRIRMALGAYYSKRVNEGDDAMSADTEVKKQIDGLQTQVTDLTKNLATITTERDTALAEIAKLKKDAETAASDEVIKVADTEVRKSQVGEAMFAVIKSQQEQIAKAETERELTLLEKKADADFGHLPGKSADKAKVLKAMQSMPEELRTDLEKMLKSGSAAVNSMMKSNGSGASYGVDQGDELDMAVAKFASDQKITDRHKAMDSFLKTDEGKKLYRQSLPRTN